MFVGNLPWTVAWQDLKDLFRDYGVEFTDVPKRDGRSRGFGIVRLETEDGAARAIGGSWPWTDCPGPARMLTPAPPRLPRAQPT